MCYVPLFCDLFKVAIVVIHSRTCCCCVLPHTHTLHTIHCCILPHTHYSGNTLAHALLLTSAATAEYEYHIPLSLHSCSECHIRMTQLGSCCSSCAAASISPAHSACHCSRVRATCCHRGAVWETIRRGTRLILTNAANMGAPSPRV